MSWYICDKEVTRKNQNWPNFQGCMSNRLLNVMWGGFLCSDSFIWCFLLKFSYLLYWMQIVLQFHLSCSHLHDFHSFFLNPNAIQWNLFGVVHCIILCSSILYISLALYTTLYELKIKYYDLNFSQWYGYSINKVALKQTWWKSIIL